MMATMTAVCALAYMVTIMIRSLDGESTDNQSIGTDIADLLTDAEKSAVASVDGDPDFIVGVRGLAQPLCFRLEGQPGQVVRLLQDPDSGVVVNARISRPVPGSPKTYLSAVLISRRNFRVVAKVGRVLVNRYRFAWGPVSVRLVHGHRVLIAPTLLALTLRNKNVTLIVKRHLPEGRIHANGTAYNRSTNSASAPNTARGALNPASGRRDRGNNAVTSGTTRRRGGRRRPDDELDRWPRRRSRRESQRRITSGEDESLSLRGRNDNKDAKDKFYSQTGVDLQAQTQTTEGVDTLLTRTRRGSSRRNRNRAATTTASPSLRGGSSGNRRSKGGAAQADVAGDDSTSGDGGVPPRELAAYVGFYVADARDLSPETHGLLGQFLHKSVTLQRIRRKSNGVVKARLLVEKPRPHHVKATLRTRTNMALNTSSTCWWLREGGLGVVDGVYNHYLVSRFRGTDLLPLPPGRIGQ